MLLNASQKVKYYKDYFEKNDHLNRTLLSSYPIIDKKPMMDNPINFIASDEYIDKLKIKKTSGFTTGQPFHIYKSIKDETAQSKELWKRRIESGIYPQMKCLMFHLYEDDYFLYEKKNRNLLFINASLFNKKLTSETMQDIHRIITEYGPEYIMSAPTLLCNYIFYSLKFNISLPDIHYIETMREFIFPFQKKYIQKYFLCPIINNYVCTEILPLAYNNSDCKFLYSFPQNVVFEILSQDGQITQQTDVFGDILVTGLNSHSMPFIRYRIGDMGKLICTKDGGEQKKQSLVLYPGRVSEYIRINKQNIHISYICKVFDEIDQSELEINKFKYCYSALNNNMNLFISLSNHNMFLEFQKQFTTWINDNNYNALEWKIHSCDYEDFVQHSEKFKFFEECDGI